MTARQFHLDAIERERLALLEQLTWEQWHGWKIVTPVALLAAPVVPIPRQLAQHWAWKERAA